MKKSLIIISIILILFSVVSCADSKMGKLKITVDSTTNNVDFDGITKASLVIQTATKDYLPYSPNAGIALKLDDVKKGSVTVALPIGAYEENTCYITLVKETIGENYILDVEYYGLVELAETKGQQANPFVIEKNKTLEATCVLEPADS